jgi:hypothetical protein
MAAHLLQHPSSAHVNKQNQQSIVSPLPIQSSPVVKQAQPQPVLSALTTPSVDRIYPTLTSRSTQKFPNITPQPPSIASNVRSLNQASTTPVIASAILLNTSTQPSAAAGPFPLFASSTSGSYFSTSSADPVGAAPNIHDSHQQQQQQQQLASTQAPRSRKSFGGSGDARYAPATGAGTSRSLLPSSSSSSSLAQDAQTRNLIVCFLLIMIGIQNAVVFVTFAFF